MRPGRWRIGELLEAFHTLSKGHKTGLHFSQLCLCCLSASLRTAVVILCPWGEWPKGPSHALTTDTKMSNSHACGEQPVCRSSAHNSPLPVKHTPWPSFPRGGHTLMLPSHRRTDLGRIYASAGSAQGLVTGSPSLPGAWNVVSM